MKSRKFFVRVAAVVLTAASVVSIVGCLGSRSYFANRVVPPSTILQRVLVAIQHANPITDTGALQIVDARYDIRNSQNGKIPGFAISGYTQSTPVQILNYPEQQGGYVYNTNGTIASINYAKESTTGSTSSLPGISSSVFVTSDGNYAFAANQPNQYVTVVDHVLGGQVSLSLPNVYRVESNPTGTVVLAFVQNSNYAYRIIRLQQPNGKVAPVPTFPNEANWPTDVSPVACQPVNLPTYCVVPVLDQNGNPIVFNRPYNLIYSPDGTTGWLLNCGPECGDTQIDPVINAAQASVSYLNLAPLNIYNFPGSTYPAPPASPQPPTERQRIAVPGGATMAVYGNSPSTTGGLLYVSGQQRQTTGPAAGLFGGFLSVVDLGTNQVIGKYQITDGTHTKMLLADDNTLWIGSQNCQTGVLTVENQPSMPNSCLTMFNTSTNTVLVEPWPKDLTSGDLTGLCAIIEWHKVYTAYGGQIHVYATTKWNGGESGPTGSNSNFAPGTVAGSELNNFFVTVQGTAIDVAYMDAPSNAAN